MSAFERSADIVKLSASWICGCIVSPAHRAVARCIRRLPLLHASLISRLICVTTASMLRLTCMSREHRADIPDRCVSTVPIWSIRASASALRTKLRFFSSILICSSSVFALACSASASARGDCCRSRRKYRR